MNDLPPFNGLPPEVQEKISAYNAARFQQLNSLVIASAEGAWQYLLAVSGGGAAAVVAFIGAVPALQKKAWPFLVLAVFAVALLLVGLGRAIVLTNMQRALKNWDVSTRAYYAGEITWKALIERDDEVADRWEFAAWVAGWLSFFLFVAGLISLAWCFFKYGVP